MRRLGTLAAAITLLTAAPASAETFTVTTNGDTTHSCIAGSCTTIRAALTAALNNGATTEDLIVVPANTYQLGSELTVASRVVIRGAGARITAIRGNRPAAATPWRVFDIGAVQATIESLTMENGGAGTENGGNLRNIGGTVLLDHVRVTNGLATNGGGIANEIGSMTIRHSLVDTNQEGGIFSLGGNAPSSLIVHDSTVALNTGAGGIRLVEIGQPSTGRLERVTVALNESGFDPGGIAMTTAGAMRVRASIISGNQGDSPGAVDCSAPLPASEGANLETEADCGFVGAGDVQNAGTAGLSGALANAGGQTDVFTLAANSPAVNRAGVCTGADQRDLPRPQGGLCDSGAYEVDQAPDTTVVATPPTFAFSSSEPGVSFQCRIDRPGRPGTFAACTSPASYASLRQGSYAFVVRAVDSGGTADPSPAVASFVVQPQATAGKFVLVKEVRGRVRVKRPGGRYVNLNNLAEIPDGSLVDTRNGVVRLSFQPKAGGKLQTAKFWDGIFKVDQRKKIMELVLVEKLAKCAQRGNATAAAKKKKSRRLWGDGKGRFRTKGQYSSATVRGTRWLTQDSCAGTLTRVRKGKVNVRDFVRKRTIRLKKGQQYLARPG